MNILKEGAGEIGYLIYNEKGEKIAETSYDIADILLNVYGAHKSISAIRGAKSSATTNTVIRTAPKSYMGESTINYSEKTIQHLSKVKFKLILSGEFIKITTSGVQTASDIEGLSK